RLILQKARHHSCYGCSDGLSAHGFRYSFTPLPGYFSPFPHGTIRYRSPGSIQPYQLVLADSTEIPRVRCYSRTRPLHSYSAFVYWIHTPSSPVSHQLGLDKPHPRLIMLSRILPAPHLPLCNTSTLDTERV